MPLYEEKIISPLAIRFTQEHIRSTFRDGRILEETVSEILESAGEGDYDVILRFPFPRIEIIRWCAPPHEMAVVSQWSGVIGETLDGRHWFSLDNRRLYCLQRAAIACWPRKVGVAVDILYADPGSMKRKYDSRSFGCSVTISPSTKCPADCRWDWRAAVLCCTEFESSENTLDSILDDDDKDAVDSLLDMPSLPGMLELHSFDNSSRGRTGRSQIQMPKTSRTPSTSASSDDGSEPVKRKSRLGARTTCMIVPAHSAKEPGSDVIPNSTSRPQHARNTREDWLVQEVIRQLTEEGRAGYVWIQDWQKLFFPHFGTLRQFLEQRSDIFRVLPCGYKRFRVELVPCAVVKK